MANRPGVMLFFDDWEPLLSLSDKDLASMLRAAINFSKYGEVPEFSGPLSIIWGIIAAKLERDQARYDKAILQKRHAVYCRITKSKGEDPLDFEEWCEQFLDHSEERTISTDNERSSSITDGIQHNKQQHPIASTSHRQLHQQKRFVPPTLEEVREYAKQKNSSVDPDRFYEYYSEGKWKDSKGNPVRNWKQRFVTWEGRNGRDQRTAEENSDPQYEELSLYDNES